MGAAGSVLMMISGVVPGSDLLFVLGLILLLVAERYISEFSEDRERYQNMTIAVVLFIIGILIGYVFVFSGFLSILAASSSGSTSLSSSIGQFGPVFENGVFGLVAVWLFFLAAAYFLKKNYDSIAESFDVGLFSTVGLLFLIGAALIIVFGVGFIIIFIAATLQLAAFLALPEAVPQKSPVDPWGRPRSSTQADPNQMVLSGNRPWQARRFICRFSNGNSLRLRVQVWWRHVLSITTQQRNQQIPS